MSYTAQILDKLVRHRFENVTPELRENILAFYGDPNAHTATKRDSGESRKLCGRFKEHGSIVPEPDIEVAHINRPGLANLFTSRIYSCSCPKLNCGGMPIGAFWLQRRIGNNG
jgi:hypothetical protein